MVGNRQLHWWIGPLAICFTLIVPSLPAAAQMTLKAVIGWGDAARLGRWTPLFVTVADTQERSIILQVQGSYGVSGSFLVRQRATVQPLRQATVYLLLIPLNAQPSRTAVTITDEITGKTLARQVLEQPASFDPAGRIPVRLVQTDHTLIGIGGNVSDALLLQAQLHRAGLVSGILGDLKLPVNAIGYEGISILVLDGADFNDIDPLQQRSIVEWVVRGGNLVVIPGADPLPSQGPVVSVLPCEVGVNIPVVPPGDWATSRPTTLNGRALSPRPGALTLDIRGLAGCARRLGLGRIVVLPADLSPLEFSADRDAVNLWRTILAGMANVPAPSRITEIAVSDEQEDIVPVGPRLSDTVGRGPRETIAIRHLLGLLDAASSHAGRGWPDLLLWLAGICAIVGPLDSMLLMRLGRSPRHWATVLGWLGLLASLGGYVVARPAAEEPQVRTFRLIDQIDSTAVAATDIVVIESNRDATLTLSLDQNEWWEPANQAAQSFPINHFLSISFREDHHGCRPEQLALKAGEPQSLRGESSAASPAILEAILKLANGRVSGTLKNKSTEPMSDVRIETRSGSCRISGSLAAGATIDVSEPLSTQNRAPMDIPADAADIAPDRTDRIQALLESGHWACVECQMPHAASVPVCKDISPVGHWQLLRDMAPLSE